MRVPVTVLLCLIIPIAVAVGLTDERRKVLLATFLDSKEADSILNHSLKNTMADPAGQLEIFLDDSDGIKDLDPRLIQNLKMALASLRRGMKSCRNRQTYIFWFPAPTTLSGLRSQRTSSCQTSQWAVP